MGGMRRETAPWIAPGGYHSMKYIRRGVLILGAVLALVYAGDYAALRFPIPKSRSAYSEVTVRPYYDVGLKSGKSDLYFLDPVQQTCANSLFPHMGFAPCWYLKRHTHPRIKM
jgi:hypothetical protein